MAPEMDDSVAFSQTKWSAAALALVLAMSLSLFFFRAQSVVVHANGTLIRIHK